MEPWQQIEGLRHVVWWISNTGLILVQLWLQKYLYHSVILIPAGNIIYVVEIIMKTGHCHHW